MKVNFKVMTIALISTLLSACGGDLQVAGNDGITGTGITAGSVTGFGSIIVNGITFNIQEASFIRDGVVLQGQTVQDDQDEFEIGEYVVIKGSVDDSDPTDITGTAYEVIFEDLLDGAVTETSTEISPGISTIEILGQLVEVNSNTSLIDDINDTTFKLTDLAIGNIVEVSGIKDSTGLIKATSIKLKEESGSENELKGTISNINHSAKTFEIGSILIDYSSATLDGFNGIPENGQFVEVNSSTEYDEFMLIADEVELENEHLVIDTGTEIEMEGIVTRFISESDFDVNGISVTTHSATDYQDGSASDIDLNVFLEVHGTVDINGTLVADEIEFEEE